VHEEGGSQTRGASGKSGELLPLRWTWTCKARSRWAPETWTSRILVAPGPRLPIPHRESLLVRWTKARFQYCPTLLTPLAKLAAAKLLPKSTLSLHPELYYWIGIRTGAAIYEGVRLQFKGEKTEHSTKENFRSVIPQVSVANEVCIATMTPFFFSWLRRFMVLEGLYSLVSNHRTHPSPRHPPHQTPHLDRNLLPPHKSHGVHHHVQHVQFRRGFLLQLHGHMRRVHQSSVDKSGTVRVRWEKNREIGEIVISCVLTCS
jgi:hypothetical protein